MYFTRLFLLLVLILSFQSGKTQDSLRTGTATVYFLRSTGATGSMGAFSTFIDDQLACHLNNKSFSIHQVAPGQHRFQAKFDGSKSSKKIKTLDLTLKAGETYYISVDVTNHAFTASIYLMEITVNTARKMLPELKEDKNCN